MNKRSFLAIACLTYGHAHAHGLPRYVHGAERSSVTPAIGRRTSPTEQLIGILEKVTTCVDNRDTISAITQLMQQVHGSRGLDLDLFEQALKQALTVIVSCDNPLTSEQVADYSALLSAVIAQLEKLHIKKPR